MPSGVTVKKVNYDDQSTLVEALKGQDVLIITMAVTAPKETQTKLIEAAAAANVPWILPNEFGGDPNELEASTDTKLGPAKAVYREHIEKLGKSSWIALVCSFWYEFSLGGTSARYGFDFKERSLVLFDEGNVRINTSTWPQCGRAVANLLALKILPDDENDKSPTLSRFKNKGCYISSFNLSQKEMFESVLRVTGTKEGDWKITSENAKERFRKGEEEMKSGSMVGFAKLLYTRYFYPDQSGSYEDRGLLDNEVLGLPKEDLDEYTRKAIKFSEGDGSGY